MGAWKDYLAAERGLDSARRQLVAAGNLEDLISSALDEPAERGPALRFLLLRDVSERVALFEKLVPLATVTSDLSIVRELIAGIPPDWLHRRLWEVVARELGRDDADDWVFRRFAELLVHLNRPEDLSKLVEFALGSDDPHTREVGRDFS